MANSKPAHSPIGASSMYRWSKCPGSVRFCKDLPSVQSSYALEGTEAHKLAAEWLETTRRPDDLGLDSINEMLNHLQIYIDTVFEDYSTIEGRFSNVFLVEHGFDLKDIHPNAYGTADCVTYDGSKMLLRVYDLKYGAGIAVEVENNEQLMYYALGALLSTKLPCKQVELVIVQPRCPTKDGLVRRWRFEPLDLLDFAADLKEAAARTEDPKAPLLPGEWCRFCPGAGICPELQTKALAIAKTEFTNLEPYDPEKLSLALESLPVIEAFVTQVREFAYAEAMKGRVPPRFKLVQKRATRKWKNEAEVTKFLENNLQDSLLPQCYTEPTLKSPAQIEKVLKHKKEMIEPFVSAESSGYKLAPLSEPGEPIKLDAKSEFKEVNIFD